MKQFIRNIERTFKSMIGNISIIVLYLRGFRELKNVDCESNERHNKMKKERLHWKM